MIETNPDFAGLPKFLLFECDAKSRNKQVSLAIFDHTLYLSEQFQRSEQDPNWANWNIRIVGPEGDPAVIPFVGISFGDWHNTTTTHRFLQDFEKVSSSGENGFGLEIYAQSFFSDDQFTFEEIVYVKNDEFLKVVSFIPVDWASLLSCLE